MRLTVFRGLTLSAFTTVALTGCAVLPPVALTSASPASLSGNWLLSGQLPAQPGIAVPVTLGGTQAQGLAATFDVTGTQVVGTLSYTQTCAGLTGFVSVTEGIVTGAVAADGTFTLTTPAPTSGGTPTSFRISGKVPSQPGGAWTGTYTSTGGSTNCTAWPAAGTVNAVVVPLLNGTYSGSATTTNGPVTFTVVLKQGGTVTSVAGVSVATNSALAGTITVQGSPCFTSGQTPATGFAGTVEGNTVVAEFTMNNGATVMMNGAITSADASTLGASFTSTSGTCSPVLASGPVKLTKL